MKRTLGAIGLPIVTGVLLLALSQFVGSYWTGILTQIVILGIFASSLDILLGYTGLPSLGHAAYFGMSAYGTGIASVNGLPAWGSILIGLLAGTVLAFAFGPLALRTTKAYFLMITLALAQIVWAAVFTFSEITGGDNGLVGISRPALGADGQLLETPHAFLAFAVLVAVMYVLVARRFLASRLGATFRAVRDNEERMEALGYSVWRLKYLAFVVSGLGASVAGVLFAYYNRFVSPELVGIPLSAEALLIVIVGGTGTFVGAFIGSGLIVIAQDYISSVSEHWLLALGLIYVVTVLFAPEGIVGKWREIGKLFSKGRYRQLYSKARAGVDA